MVKRTEAADAYILIRGRNIAMATKSLVICDTGGPTEILTTPFPSPTDSSEWAKCCNVALVYAPSCRLANGT